MRRANVAILLAFRLAFALHERRITMKNTDKTNTPSTSIETPVAIDTAALDDVTGGCACGQDCPRGLAPAVANGTQQPDPFSPFGR